MKIILEHWDAIEIFCKFISQVYKKKIDDLVLPINDSIGDYSNARIRRLLDDKHFRSAVKTEKVARKIFGTKRDDQDKEVAKYSRNLYEFVRDVYNSMPHIPVDDDFLKAILNEINDEELKQWKRKSVIQFDLNDTQREFENTIWYVYFFNDFIKMNKQFSGISRGVLKLNQFGKATFNTIRPGDSIKEDYIGTYRLFGSEKEPKKYMDVELAEPKSFERNFNIRFQLGSTQPEKIFISLGQFANINRSIYTCSVILRQADKRRAIKTSKFFDRSKKEDVLKEIPEYMWRYFEDKSKNVLGVPSTNIATEHDFVNWYNSKHLGQEPLEVSL